MTLVDSIRGRFDRTDIHFKVRERLNYQKKELESIVHDADAIEKYFTKRKLPLPLLYNLCTIGLTPPEQTQQIGKYGEGAFYGFVPTEIKGHDGTVSYEDGMLFFNGRAHPNEWAGDEMGPMIVAHQLNVVKELIRRQRAKDGVDPLVILTYVVGVREGHPMKTGDLALFIDDKEETNFNHPGHGARALLNEKLAPHFQPKAGRACNQEVARAFVQYANEVGYQNVFPAVTVGTPGTTEFQGHMEVASLDNDFDRVKNGNIREDVEAVFGEGGMDKLSLTFDMGITAELAVMRQKFAKEKEFNFVAFGLGTDPVGGKESRSINHDQVHDMAIAKGPFHRGHIIEFARRFDTRLPQKLPDYSIKRNS